MLNVQVHVSNMVYLRWSFERYEGSARVNLGPVDLRKKQSGLFRSKDDWRSPWNRTRIRA